MTSNRAESFAFMPQGVGLTLGGFEPNTFVIYGADDQVGGYGIVDVHVDTLELTNPQRYANKLGYAAINAMMHVYDECDPVMYPELAERLSHRVMDYAHNAINDRGVRLPETVKRNIGASAVGLGFFVGPDNRPYVMTGHVGSCRLYERSIVDQHPHIQLLTLDDTVAVNNLDITNGVNGPDHGGIDYDQSFSRQLAYDTVLIRDQIDENNVHILSQEEQELFKQSRSLLTAGIGCGENLPPQFTTAIYPFQRSSEYLLVSGGITLNLTRQQIEAIWNKGPFEQVPDRLIKAASNEIAQSSYRSVRANMGAVIVRAPYPQQSIALPGSRPPSHG